MSVRVHVMGIWMCFFFGVDMCLCVRVKMLSFFFRFFSFLLFLFASSSIRWKYKGEIGLELKYDTKQYAWYR